MGYSVKEIDNMLNVDMFYRKDCLNYKGEIDDEKQIEFDGKPYYEYIASYLLKSIKNNIFEDLLFGNLNFAKKEHFVPMDRRIDFGDNTDNAKYTKRHEEKIVMNLIYTSTEVDGFIPMIKQVPVNRQDGNFHGKVDMVLVNKDNDMIIAEVKDNDSKETLLRAIVEIITYKIKIDKNWENEGCCDDFKYLDKDKSIKINKIIPSVMIFKSRPEIDILSEPWEEFCEIKKDSDSYMYKLIEELVKKYGLRIYEIDDVDAKNKKEALQPNDYELKKYSINRIWE